MQPTPNITNIPLPNTKLMCAELENIGHIYYLDIEIPQGLHLLDCRCKDCTIIIKKSRETRHCYKCNKKGHLYRDCPGVSSRCNRTCNNPKVPSHEITREEPGWGTPNPNWETQSIPQEWTTPSAPTLIKEEDTSDYARHWQQCFKKGHCPH
jgi:hypothetical protein